jgi:hypothetical protein
MELNPEQMRELALRNLGNVTTSKSGEVGSFLETACLWLGAWCATKSQRKKNKLGYCAFVLDVDIVANPPKANFQDKPWFKDDHTPNLGGNLYVADYALNRVHHLPAQCADLDEVIALAKQQGLTGRAAVVFDTDSQAVFLFPSGVETRPTKFSLRVPLRAPFDCAELLRMLDRIYLESLRYPETLPAIWNDPKNHVPGREVERTIQGHVCHVLQYSTQGHNCLGGTPVVIRERTNNAGRADIVVIIDACCMVAGEIKVLRHRHFSETKKLRSVSAKFNDWWANRGARQAHRYKEVEAAMDGVLLLYDMRASDAEMEAAKELCSKLKIRYKRYFLHNRGPAD